MSYAAKANNSTAIHQLINEGHLPNLDGHINYHSDSEDDIFSFREGGRPRKKTRTPDFEIRSGEKSSVLKTATPLTIPEDEVSNYALAREKPEQKKTISGEDDKFFKFTNLMFKSKLSTNLSNTSTCGSPDVRTKHHQTKICLNNDIQICTIPSLDFIKSKRIQVNTPNPIRKNSLVTAYNIKYMSPQKQPIKTFELAGQQTRKSADFNSNLLEFVFKDGEEILYKNQQFSIEDDIVSTPTRHREMKVKNVKCSGEFKISLQAAESLLGKFSGFRIALNSLTDKMNKRDSETKIGNLIDLSVQESKDTSICNTPHFKESLGGKGPHPNKRRRFKLQLATKRLIYLFERRVKGYIALIADNKSVVENICPLTTRVFAQHPVKRETGKPAPKDICIPGSPSKHPTFKVKL